MKMEAWELQNKKCTICGKYINPKAKREMSLVAHHVINQSQGGKGTMDNIEIRHCKCEAYAHKVHRFGNPPREVTEVDDLPKFRFRKKRR